MPTSAANGEAAGALAALAAGGKIPVREVDYRSVQKSVDYNLSPDKLDAE
jgi:hypothetical protein